ncbi:MAG TPA: hypothetical protein VK168_20330 [Saprospiraceae bacterium]|nr:hypothetical protein [Saprospiraceae bacterium]
MKLLNLILVVDLMLVLSCTTVPKSLPKNFSAKVESDIEKCLKKTLNADDLKFCKNYSVGILNDFYAKELDNFLIYKALTEIDSFIQENKRDYNNYQIYLILYYPFTGFDPESSYITEYIIKNSDPNKKSFIKKIDLDDEKSKYNELSLIEVSEKINFYRTLSFGCETSLVIVFSFSATYDNKSCDCRIGF